MKEINFLVKKKIAGRGFVQAYFVTGTNYSITNWLVIFGNLGLEG